MKRGKGSKHQIRYQSFRIRSFPYARRPWLWRKRGRHITESPPSFQYEHFLFGHHKTFLSSLLGQNAYQQVLYYRIIVHLVFLNSAVRQVLVPFRTFWCSILVLCLLARLMSVSNFVKQAVKILDIAHLKMMTHHKTSKH